MSRNGKHSPPRPRIRLRQTSATPEETAAITAAIEHFLRDTAPAPGPRPALSPWLRAGLFENAGLEADAPSPWSDPEPWGRSSGG